MGRNYSNLELMRINRSRIIRGFVGFGVDLFIGSIIISVGLPMLLTSDYVYENNDIYEMLIANGIGTLTVTALFFLFLILAIVSLIQGFVAVGRWKRARRRWIAEGSPREDSAPRSFDQSAYQKAMKSSATPVRARPVKETPQSSYYMDNGNDQEEENDQERFENALTAVRAKMFLEDAFQSFLDDMNAYLEQKDSEEGLPSKNGKYLSGTCAIDFGHETQLTRRTALIATINLSGDYSDITRLPALLRNPYDEESDDELEEGSYHFYESGKENAVREGDENFLIQEFIYRVNATIGPIWEKRGKVIAWKDELVSDFIFKYHLDWKCSKEEKKKMQENKELTEGAIHARIAL
ncbi:MAG: hypothetical protein J5736_05885 [Bacilli bacterium]|nr:hypothetical protein [Bacilli bacterium]